MKLYSTASLSMNLIGFLFVLLLGGLQAPLLAQPWHNDGVLITTPQKYQTLHDNAEEYFKKRGTGKGTGYKAYKRWDHYWNSRVNASGTFPPANVRQNEWNKYLAQTPLPQGIGGSSWTSLGPNSSTGGYAGIGRINRVAFHPTDVNTFFACTAGGGLWKTINGGSSWTNLTNSLSRLGTSDLIVDPSNPSVLYLATGDCDAGDTPSIGVLKSTDGGVTWNATGLSFNDGQYVSIYKLIRHSTNANILFAATSNGIYKTTNAGGSWTLTLSGSTIYDMAQKSGTPTTYFASSASRVYISTDEGVTWTVRSTITGSGRTSIAVTPANPDFVGVLATKSSDYSFLGFYSSTDGGLNYTLRSSTPNILGWESNGSGGSGQGWYDLSLAIDPTNANTIYVGGINTWKSTNGGSSWTINTMWYPVQSIPTVHADKHDLAFQNNSTLFECNDGGIYKTTNGGSSWTDLSNGMTISQIYRIGVSQLDTKTIAGLQDNGTKLRGTTGTWTDVIGGDGMDCAINPTNASVLYGEYQNGGLHRSTNGGVNWTEIIPENGNASGAWISPIVIDPNNNQTIYFGTNRAVYKSTNQGTAWTNISSTLSLTYDVDNIAVAPSNSSYIYFVTGYYWTKEIYRTTNGGTSWAKMTTPINDRITWLSVNPTDPNIIYITYANYTSGSKVYRSANGGSTWTNITGTLPNLPANCIVYQTGSNGALYLGMDAGVFYRDNSMSDWSLFNSDLPNVEVFELEIKYNTNKILAATYGRGLWESPLYTTTATPALTVSPTTQSVVATSGNFPVTVTSNIAWSVSSNAAWLTASPTSGAGNGSVSASYAANTGAQRSGVLTFTGSGITQTVTVTQAAAPSLTVTPTFQSVASTAGSSTITVASNVAWTVSSNAAWLTASPTSGSNNGAVTASFTANTGTSRTGILTFSGGGITTTATITQAAPPTLAVTPSTQSVDASAGSFPITVSSNIAWTISSNASWLTTSPSAGSNNLNVTANYAANTGAARTGTLTFSGSGLTRTVTVSQADGRTFYVSPETYAATASSGSFTLNIIAPSFSTWSTSSNVSWLSASQFFGFGTGAITVNHESNTGATRTGVITISSNFETRTVTVTQSAFAAPVLTVSPPSSSVANTAGSFVATVTANVAWTTSSNVNWLSASPSTGTGNGSINLSYTANTGAARTGVLTLSGGGVSTSVTVTQAAAPASLTVTPTTQSVAAAAGNFGITVTSNIAWSVSSNAAWLTASPTSGTGNGSVSASYTANSGAQRSGVLTFTGSGITQTVTVTQAAAAASLTVTPTTQSVAATAGNFPVTVTSNIAWSVSSNAAWLTASPTSGTGNGSVSASYTANSGAQRSGVLTFTGSGITQTVTVTQAAAAASLTVTPTTQSVAATAGNFPVTVTSNIAWSVSSNAAWLTASPTSGTGNGSVSASYTANTGAQRSGVLTFTGSGITQTVTVTQAAAASLTVTPTTQSVAATAGNFGVTVTSNIAWSVSSNAAWLTASPTSGTGNGSVSASYAANTGAQRSGVLTFTGSGLTQTVTVTQAAVASSLTVTPTFQSVAATAGSSTITVASNIAWSVSSNAAWLTASPTSGSNNGTVTANYTANTGAARTGILTFTGGGITATATITQAGSVTLNVTPSTQSVDASAGSFPITVSSNIAWTISSNASWLTTSPSAGSNNLNVTANYAANTGAARTGTLTFSGSGLTRTVTVSQADGRTFYVSPETYAATASSGSFTLNIIAPSFSTWSTSSNVSWLSASQFFGFGTGAITVNHESNTGATRTGVITISSNFESRTVTVTQSGNTTPVLTISPSSRSVADAAGSFIASVTANVPWTASSNAAWLSMSPNSGTGNSSVTLSHTANTGALRTGIVTLSGGGVSTTITVTQAAGPSLTVTPTSQSVAANAGNFGITVSANIAWTVSSNANWLTSSPTSGSNNGTVTASYTANAGVARTGTLTFSGGGITRTVTVSQAAPTANFLTVSPSSKTIPAGSDTFQIIVRSNVAWTLISSGAWMMPNTNNGNGNATAIIYYQQNQNGSLRRDTLTFSGAGITQKVVVTQNAGTGASLTVTPSTINANATASTAPVNITASGCWTVSDNASWVLPSVTEGVGNASLLLFIQANSGVARSATVTIVGNGGTRTVTINQATVGNLVEPDLAIAPTNLSLDHQASSLIPKMELYPNPAQETVNIVLDAVDVKQDGIQLVVIDAYGRVVMKQQLNSVFTKISLSNLSNGMYTFSMLLPNAKMLSKKLIVTRTE